jgi:hypothetical protein
MTRRLALSITAIAALAVGVGAVGSATAAVTAATVLRLVESGKLRLDDQLKDLLPSRGNNDQYIIVKVFFIYLL